MTLARARKRIEEKLNDLNRIVKIQLEKHKETMKEWQLQQRTDLEYFLNVLKEELEPPDEDKILTAQIEQLLKRRENPDLSNTDKIRLTSALYRRKNSVEIPGRWGYMNALEATHKLIEYYKKDIKYYKTAQKIPEKEKVRAIKIVKGRISILENEIETNEDYLKNTNLSEGEI